ncbi:MAG: SPFH domain-containing protein [Anaerolineae bacterium]
MFILIVSVMVMVVVTGFVLVFKRSTVLVPEDHGAVVVDRNGFVRRTLPAGVHRLWPGRERIEFIFETNIKLCRAVAEAIPTADGIPLRIAWSGTYHRDPDLITDRVSQRLRGLPRVEWGIQRQVDIALRRLVGAYDLTDLFRPSVRERIERQLTEAIAARLKLVGVVLHGVNLQAMELPQEVSSALNQARAIQALDAVIRRSDATTREVVTAGHKLEELLAWSEYLPPYGRPALALRQP